MEPRVYWYFFAALAVCCQQKCIAFISFEPFLLSPFSLFLNFATLLESLEAVNTENYIYF